MNREGILWQNESYDHIIRDEKDFHNTLSYIWHNPVKKDLCEKAEDYQWYYQNNDLGNAGWKPAPLGKINYTVWSDILICGHCGDEVNYWETAINKDKAEVKEVFSCLNCSSEIEKKKTEKAYQSYFDDTIEDIVRIVKQVPVLINYSIGKKRHEKVPDNFDLDIITKIDGLSIHTNFQH